MEIFRRHKQKPEKGVLDVLRELNVVQNNGKKDREKKRKLLQIADRDFSNRKDSDPRIEQLRAVINSKDIQQALASLSRVWCESSRHTHIEERGQGRITEWHQTEIKRKKFETYDAIRYANLKVTEDEVGNLDLWALMDDVINEAVSNGILYYFPQEVETYSTFSTEKYYKRNRVRTKAGSFNFRINWENDQVFYTLEELDDQKNPMRIISSSDKTTVAVPIANVIFHEDPGLLFELPAEREKRKRY